MQLFDDQVEDFSKLEFGEQRLLHFLYQDIYQMGRDGRIRKLFSQKRLHVTRLFPWRSRTFQRGLKFLFSFFFLFFNLKWKRKKKRGGIALDKRKVRRVYIVSRSSCLSRSTPTRHILVCWRVCYTHLAALINRNKIWTRWRRRWRYCFPQKKQLSTV